MNWALLILGVPVGILSCRIGDWLLKKLKPKSSTLQAIVHITPLMVCVCLVILVDVIF